jgi:hypothetical protein
LSCLSVGCQLDRTGTGLDLGDAAGADAAAEAAPDAATDAATDAADAVADAVADAIDDVVEPEASPDVISDAPADVAEDSPVDSPLDAVEEPDGPVVSAGFALSFSDGDDTYVALGNVEVPLDFTIEAWIRPASTPGETYILAKDRAGQTANQFRFGLTGQDYLFFIMSNSTGNHAGLWDGSYALASPDKVPMNTWTHVAVVKESTAFRLLVNGVVVRSMNASGDIVHDGSQSMRLAARMASDGGASGPFDGIIDEVRLFSTARAEAVIAAERGAPQTPASLWWPNLVAYWRLDEGAGLTTQDERGNYPGTLVNGPLWVESDAF